LCGYGFKLVEVRPWRLGGGNAVSDHLAIAFIHLNPDGPAAKVLGGQKRCSASGKWVNNERRFSDANDSLHNTERNLARVARFLVTYVFDLVDFPPIIKFGTSLSFSNSFLNTFVFEIFIFLSDFPEVRLTTPP